MLCLHKKTIVIGFSEPIGRLGNYLYTIALCTKILYDLKNYKYKSYLYFPCEMNIKDGHGNINAFGYDNTINSYHNSIFKFEKNDDTDLISSITSSLEIVQFDGNKLLLEQFNSDKRILWSKNCDEYNVIFDLFPIIIESLKFNNSIFIFINNLFYEELNYISPLYKNLYMLNNKLSDKLYNILNNLIIKYNCCDYIFIKLNCNIIYTYTNFHSKNFRNYFSDKLFNYKFDEISVKKYINELYNNCINRFNQTKFVSLHFRGGDYGDNSKDAQHFAVIGPQYYIDCISKIMHNDKKADYMFVFFSSNEDYDFIEHKLIPYIKNKINCNLISEYTFLNGVKINAQLNLLLLGQFDKMCLSNSTYSWWSYYFSKHFNSLTAYVPVIYNYPDAHVINNFNINVVHNNQKIALNNYFINFLQVYGYSSSIYMDIMIKNILIKIIPYIKQININSVTVKIFLNKIECNHFYNNEIRNSITMTKKNIYQILHKPNINKTELSEQITNLYSILYSSQSITNKFYTLECIDRNNVNFIKVCQIFNSVDRIDDTNKFYKNVEIHDGITNIQPFLIENII